MNVRRLLFQVPYLAVTVTLGLNGPGSLAAQLDVHALPNWVTPYTVKGELSWSNLWWVEARFQGSSESGARWAELMQWVGARRREQTEAIRGEFGRAGVSANALAEGCYDDDACQLITDIDSLVARFPEEFPNFQRLITAAREATPAIEGFRLAVQTAWHVASMDHVSVAERLHAALICDQAYMIAITGFKYAEREPPALPGSALELFYFGLRNEMRKQNRANVDFVKEWVINKGWPKHSDVGDAGESAMWLIVQHADQDPVFQYRMLGKMGALVANGQASAKDQAYLYDRVMLKLNGKQRYGTQLTCKDGSLVPRSLEEPRDQLDAYRKVAGLPPISEYLRGFTSSCAR